MHTGAPMLSIELLLELEARWRSQGAPIADHLRPGLNDREIDEATRPLGLRLPTEARIWWGWHDGASLRPNTTSDTSRLLGPGREYLPLLDAVALYEQELEIFRSVGDDAELLRPTTRFPITYSSGPISCDCAIAEGDPTPIYHVHSHDYDIDGVTHPKARSFGEMVTWWIEALNDEIWKWDPSTGSWDYFYKRLHRQRGVSGLV